MKKVLIILGKKKWNGPVFSQEETKTYQHCYEYLYQWAEEEDVLMFRASVDWYDKKRNIFKYAWTFKNNKWERAYNIKPDLIYDKTKLTPENHYFKQELKNHFPIINNTDFTLLLDNKFFTSLLFPKFSKKHYLINSFDDLKSVAKKIKGSRIVLKKNSGSGGKDVIITEKNKINKLKRVDFKDFSVQEFIDSSKGIKGITDSYHDLRLVFINDELIYSYIRTPKKGSLLANLSQGGSMRIVKPKDLPKSTKALIKNVKEVLDSYNPKIYTIDIMFDEKQSPWIVELNTMPGLYFSPDQALWMKKMYLKLIKLFKNSILK